MEAVSSHKPLQEDELNLSRGENANVLKKTSDGNDDDNDYEDDDVDDEVDDDDDNVKKIVMSMTMKRTS